MNIYYDANKIYEAGTKAIQGAPFKYQSQYYANGIWNKTRVYNAVGKWITEEEYKEITGEEYSENA